MVDQTISSSWRIVTLQLFPSDRCARRGSGCWRLEINDRMENAALEAAFGEFGEEALHRVEPRTRGRCEVG